MEARRVAEPEAGIDRPYLLSSGQVASLAGVDPARGLSADDARARLSRHGPNVLKQTQARSALGILLAQLRNPLLVILTIGAGISGWTGHWIDAAAILAIVLINAAISFWQEWNAAKTMAALTEMAAPRATVRRDGAWQDVAAADLVPGDVLRLQRGDIVGADVCLLEAAQLQIDEAPLTGESEPVDKHADPLAPGPDGDVPLGDRLNMAFASTQVGKGTGIGIVTATGMGTEVGRIAGLMAAAEEPKTPLQARIDGLARVLMGAALTVVAVVVGIGLAKGMDTAEILNTAISLSVSTIPEGLPTIVTIVLALGSQGMARQNALVRKLASVETLGTTSVICSDKTGTLTQNKMQVMRVWAGGASYDVTGDGFGPAGDFLDAEGVPVDAAQHGALKALLALSAWCNEAQLTTEDGVPAVNGNPTEGALLVAAAKAGIARAALAERHGLRTLQAFPFDSTRKMMSLLSDVPGIGRVLVAKGAPDVILARATHVEMDGAPVPLDDARRAELEGVIAAFGADALRTLAVAYRRVPDGDLGDGPADYERDVVIVGIHGIMDPPRAEVATAVAEARSASVRTVMITGDHAATAEAIAGRIGIRTSAGQTVHTGAEVEAMRDDDLVAAVENAAVFARVTPEHKLRIVRALQARGDVVAMTGDGVNDAPALRSADIGIAMGITGTAVSKESASLILLDDNFSTIVTAVREGRRIYDNLLKFVRQGLTANVAEVSAILFAFLLMGDEPLLTLAPLMILWVNLVSDGVPALALGTEPAEPDIMHRPPRPRAESIFAGGLKSRILLRGLAIGGTTYWIFQQSLALGNTVDYAQTAAFATLVFAQLWHIFDSRTVTTLYDRNPFENRMLLGAVALSALLSLGAIYTGAGHLVLGTAPLATGDLLACIAIAALPTLVLSGLKALFGFRWL